MVIVLLIRGLPIESMVEPGWYGLPRFVVEEDMQFARQPDKTRALEPCVFALEHPPSADTALMMWYVACGVYRTTHTFVSYTLGFALPRRTILAFTIFTSSSISGISISTYVCIVTCASCILSCHFTPKDCPQAQLMT